MKAPDFGYERPETLAAACQILADDSRDAVVLAGGQSLMPMMNFRMARPDILVDLGGIPDLRGVREEGEDLVIGAMTRYAELLRDPLIAAHVPLFGMALPHIAHGAIRNRGTIGGSAALCDPAAEMPALLLALEAELTVEGVEGRRSIAADAFFQGLYETALAPGEVLVDIRVPKAGAQVFGFYELARRHGDYAMAGVALAGQRGGAMRVAFFSVSDCALRARAAEAALSGSDLGDAAIEGAIAGLAEIDFAGDLNADIATKQHLAGVVLRRAVEEMR